MGCLVVLAAVLAASEYDGLSVAVSGSSTSPQAAGEDQLVVDEQIAFLYYKNLEEADAFFGGTLGLNKSTNLEWVKIFRTVRGSFIGCVQEGRGSLKTSPDKPVMISWVVRDVDVWHQRLSAKGVRIIRPPRISQEPRMKSFLFADPTGYTFELVEWLGPR